MTHLTACIHHHNDLYRFNDKRSSLEATFSEFSLVKQTMRISSMGRTFLTLCPKSHQYLLPRLRTF